MKWPLVPIATAIRSVQYGLSVPSDNAGDMPIVGMKDVVDGRVHVDPETRVRLDASAAEAYILKDGDVLLNRTNSPSLVGKVGMFRGSQRAVFASYLVRIEFETSRIDPQFAVQVLASEPAQRQIRQLATRAVSQANLNPTTFKNHFLLPLPPLSVQVAIRAALVAWDEVIEKVGQLVAAKELELRALRQRVFRDRKVPPVRLQGITRRVSRKNIGGSGQPLTISGNEGLVSQASYYGKRIAAENADHYTLLWRGEFAYNRSTSTGYPLGAIKRLDACDEGIVSSLYLCFALDESVNSDYFVHFCEAGGFNRQLYQVAQEGARNHGLLSVTVDDFFGMSMPLPSCDEQERVVRVLGAATRELSLLRDMVRALKTQKRGLMQKLLTGQWRLPAHEQEPA